GPARRSSTRPPPFSAAATRMPSARRAATARVRRCAPTRRTPTRHAQSRERSATRTRPVWRGRRWRCSTARTRSPRCSRTRWPHSRSRSASAAGCGSCNEQRSARCSTGSRTPRDAGPVAGFLTWLRATLRSDDGDLASGDAVELLTFHRAKGLEYETVFVTGVERGLVPVAYASSPVDLDEERRLLHVAMTRAGTALHMSWARTRTVGSRVSEREPSPWITALRAAGVVDDAATTASAHAGTRRALGARGPRPRATDDALLTALLEWRRGVARAAAVPVAAVASDATLRAIATRRPRSRAALASVPGLGPCRLATHG